MLHVVNAVLVIVMMRDQHPSKHAGSDLEEFWLRPVTAIMVIMASMKPQVGQTAYA